MTGGRYTAIPLYSLDPKLVEMTVGCEICHMNSITEASTQENIVVTHEAIQKYIHTILYFSILLH
jgi:hypothetical protein